MKRADKHAAGMGFADTPVYLIGPFPVAAPLDRKGFEKTTADARERRT